MFSIRVFLTVIAAALLLFLYLLPSYLAFRNRKRLAGIICALNIFVAWTVVGWILLFAWGNTPEQDDWRAKRATENAEGHPVRRISTPRVILLSVASIVALTVVALVVVMEENRRTATPVPEPTPIVTTPIVKIPETPSVVSVAMGLAQEDVQRGDYAEAESLYREILVKQPDNIEVMKALAGVLYREDKIEESAEVLEHLPR